MTDRSTLLELAEHKVVVGASGNRWGCRVCRTSAHLADFSPNPAWKLPCSPTADALAKFEHNAREAIAGALADLQHAAALRALANQPEDKSQ